MGFKAGPLRRGLDTRLTRLEQSAYARSFAGELDAARSDADLFDLLLRWDGARMVDDVVHLNPDLDDPPGLWDEVINLAHRLGYSVLDDASRVVL